MFINKTKTNLINLRALADRGAPNWDKVPDEDFPEEIRTHPNAEAEIARLRKQLKVPVPPRLCKVGSHAVLDAEQAEAKERRAKFYASRILMKVTRARHVSSLPPEMNPIIPGQNGKRTEFPDGRWVGAPPAWIEALQESHGQLMAQVKNRKPPTDIPMGSDIAFAGMEVVYFELKNFNVAVAIPPSAYPKKKAA